LILFIFAKITKQMVKFSEIFRLKNFLTLFLCPFLLTNCNDYEDVVPYVYVNFYISLADPDFAALNTPGNSVMVTGGANGILIYRIDIEEFAAYDRTCTHEISSDCVIFTDESGLFGIDTTCCYSEFLLLDGSVSKGPARFPLKRYRTYFDGYTLHVYN
jgi:Rieske Fe-S protein